MIGSIEEPEVKIYVPANEARILKEKIEHVVKDKLPVGLLKKIKLSENALVLSVSEVCWIRENIEIEQPLHEWLSKCEIQLPEPPVIPRSPELEARVQRLRLEQEEKDYQTMTRNVDTRRTKYPDESIASQGILNITRCGVVFYFTFQFNFFEYSPGKSNNELIQEF